MRKISIVFAIMIMMAAVSWQGCVSLGNPATTPVRVSANEFCDPVTEKLVEFGADTISWELIKFESKKKGNNVYIYEMILRESGSNFLFPEMIYTAKFKGCDLVAFELLIWMNINKRISENFNEIGVGLSRTLYDVHESLRDKLDDDDKYVEIPSSRE